MVGLSLKNQSRIVIHAIMCGAACFIPIPFLDEWTQQKIGKHMISGILDSYQKASEPASRTLSRRYSTWCMGCLIGIFIYPIKKLIRTIAIFLTIKQLVDECEYWLYRGVFIELAIQLNVDLNHPQNLSYLHKRINRSMNEIDSKIIFNGIKGVFEGGRQDILQIARASFRWVRGEGNLNEIVPKAMVGAISQLVTPEYIQHITQLITSDKEIIRLEQNTK